MKKRIVVLLLCFGLLFLTACDNTEYEDIESTIIQKEARDDGTYWFHVEYELEGFYAPLEAQIKVSSTVYNQYNVGDTYIYQRPVQKITR